MAYDRYDTRRERDSSRRSDYDDRGRGRGEERGFLDRAGDEIASWFGDDDDRRERGYGDRDRERGDWGRDRERDEERGSARPMRWTSSNEDYRSGHDDSDWDRGPSGSRDRGYRPMAGDYGRSDDRGGYGRSQTPWGRDDYRRTSHAGSGHHTDPHYHDWRQRQLEELDRDYDEYHRERQQRFEDDFGSWRQNRQQKRQVLSQAREHMDVVGSDGETVGKIDRIADDRVILTKNDSPDGRRHSIPCTMIDRVEDDRLVLDCSAEEARKQWGDEGERALFERRDSGEGGPHMLDRSFSGTYR